jgi:hypothetical protein
MNNVQQTKLNVYQERALVTRKRRQAAALYETPAQKKALNKYLAGGIRNLNASDIARLATMPTLAASQRAMFAALAEAK